MAANQTDDPAIIEEDVERTQDAMGDTARKLEERLNVRNIGQSLLGEDNAATAREAWEVVRHNPIPVAMIVGGVGWLLAKSDAPMISRLRDELKSRFTGAIGSAASGSGLRPRAEEPAPIGPPPATGEAFDRRRDVTPS
jgi:Protein of unknown function (DUF3618)